ncbi:MAG: leucine-rich repeat domain-containing protein [Lachnospiraceae bacterium]|nr:leucine-rich repeat domain-containing protein [Lachnospiraceae bacterium]
MHRLNDIITETSTFQQGYLYRQGYMFAPLTQSNIYDAIVIKNPSQCQAWCPSYGFSDHTLEEHIELINQFQLEKAIIIAEDISFITQCPSLKYIKIVLADTAVDKFDYSPLYEMPFIKYLTCVTAYGGPQEHLHTTIDYSKVKGLCNIGISGKGHLNYNLVDTLEELHISGDKIHQDLTSISNSPMLKRMWFLQCGLKTLAGIERFTNIQDLSFDYMRSLHDISHLSYVADSLRALSIENCPKITNFSILYDLVNLEHLHLHGKNELPSLDFVNKMKKLKTFVFSMSVQDYDLSPCLQIPYASTYHNRKQYNLKDKDLPKILPTEPFKLQ